MAPFQMTVQDTFFLEDGTTILAGYVQSEMKFIRACECEIVGNGEVKMTLQIDGEMRPNRRPGSDATIRAVSTRERLDLAGVGLGTGGFLLRSKEP